MTMLRSLRHSLDCAALFVGLARQILVARLDGHQRPPRVSDDHDRDEDRMIASFGWQDAAGAIAILAAIALAIRWLS